jgi:hypothetical protein
MILEKNRRKIGIHDLIHCMTKHWPEMVQCCYIEVRITEWKVSERHIVEF